MLIANASESLYKTANGYAKDKENQERCTKYGPTVIKTAVSLSGHSIAAEISGAAAEKWAKSDPESFTTVVESVGFFSFIVIATPFVLGKVLFDGAKKLIK